MRWRTIPGFPAYAVSETGRVRNTDRGRDLKPDKGNRGHLRVRLYRRGQSHMFWVHRLVIAAFGPPKPPGEHFVLHRDDDRANNTVGNLYWGTRLDNAADAERNGRRARGRQTKRASLDAAIVKSMRARYPQTSAAALAREHGVSRSCASAAIRGDTWGWVK